MGNTQPSREDIQRKVFLFQNDPIIRKYQETIITIKINSLPNIIITKDSVDYKYDDNTQYLIDKYESELKTYIKNNYKEVTCPQKPNNPTP